MPIIRDHPLLLTYYDCFEHYHFPWPTVTPQWHLQFANYLAESGQLKDLPKTYTPGEETSWEQTVCDVIRQFNCDREWEREFAEDLENAKLFISSLCIAGMKETERREKKARRDGKVARGV